MFARRLGTADTASRLAPSRGGPCRPTETKQPSCIAPDWIQKFAHRADAWVYLADFTLIVIPLLSVSADVLEKFQSANQKFGRLRVCHLDELLPDYCPTYNEFLNLYYSAKRSNAATTYVFLSPQFLVKHPDALRPSRRLACRKRADAPSGGD